jgi:predicted GH43/DUF377 family glycosyl hydrolase
MIMARGILKRYEGNPILTPDMVPGADAVMNGCPVLFNGKIILLQPIVWAGSEFPSIHVADSDDGIHFSVRKDPLIKFTNDPNSVLFHVDRYAIDPRVTKIGDHYYIMRPSDSYLGTCTVLGRTADFLTYEHMEVVSLPMNRVPCLFPEKIDGLYARLDRPTGRLQGDIWISFSPDLIHWGQHLGFECFDGLPRHGFGKLAADLGEVAAKGAQSLLVRPMQRGDLGGDLPKLMLEPRGVVGRACRRPWRRRGRGRWLGRR